MELLGQLQPPQRAHQRPQPRLGPCLVEAVGAEQQHAPGPEAPGQVVQQLQRGGVGPVQVVDQQRHRPLGRDPLDQPGHRLEHAGPLQGGVPQRLRRRQVQPGEQPAEIGQPADQRGQPAGLQPGQERPQHLQHRRVGQIGLERVGGALEGDEPAPAGQGERLHGQPGLADAGLAGEEHRPARPDGGAVQRDEHPAELLGPPDQRNVRRARQGMHCGHERL